MSNVNLDLLGGSPSSAAARSVAIAVPSGHGLAAFWIEPDGGGRAHLQKADEIDKALCGYHFRTETHLRRSVAPTQACAACVAKTETPPQRGLF